MKKISLLFCFQFIVLCMASATVYLPAIFSNHMVLQQNTTVKIWGWSEVEEKVTIKPSWDTTTYTVNGSSYAKWQTNITTPKAGGVYTITVKGAYNEILIEDVLIGEVWLTSGQSNMEMTMYWGLKYDEEAKNATNKNIRFFHIPKSSAEYPQENVRAQWVVCSPEAMKNFSAAAYFFGKKLNEQLNVPVGLIAAAWGGTPAEVWTPEDIITNDKILAAAAGKLQPSRWWPVLPAYTYNAMIAPVTNFKIAGAIWYQGEANVGAAATYPHLFTTMINTWRQKWGSDFPFYFVQIAPYNYGDNSNGVLLREAQTKSAAYPKTGMVVISDLVDNVNDIHPKLKKEVGERLADYALADTYGKINLPYKSPLYKSMAIEKNKATISFYNADNGLMIKGKDATEFYIAGDDKHFVPAKAKIKGNSIIVWSDSVKQPVAVRFGFTNTAMPNLFTTAGLPVNLFRTDEWDVNTNPAKK